MSDSIPSLPGGGSVIQVRFIWPRWRLVSIKRDHRRDKAIIDSGGGVFILSFTHQGWYDSSISSLSGQLYYLVLHPQILGRASTVILSIVITERRDGCSPTTDLPPSLSAWRPAPSPTSLLPQSQHQRQTSSHKISVQGCFLCERQVVWQT